MERRVGGDAPAGAGDWLLALVAERRDAVEEAAAGGDLDAILAAGESEEEGGGGLPRAEIEQRASQCAAEQDRDVIAPADLAAAILDAQRAPVAEEPEAGERDIASPLAAEPAERAAPVEGALPRPPEQAPAPEEKPEPAAPRAIRVFVSSTFRDMQAERDELTLRIFPQLRKLCERRGVTWGEVDLRWGITEEEAKEGRVLPICLAQIERCRPYFIGLLGERYGWVPEEIEPDLIERQPWLKEHLERSVTELEIDYGVLLNPAMAGHAFFYLRDPAYLDSLPERERAEYLEHPTSEEIEEHGEEEAERRAQGRRDKLAALKERLLGSELPVEPAYPDPKALGELVLRDVRALIDELYPEGSEPDPLGREAAEHEAFAQSRAAVYVGRSAYFERLDAHAAGEDAPLLVLGESGSGKSALLANWALRYREAHPEELVLTHFIGSSPQSSDWRAMLRRVIGELGRRFGIEAEIPDDPARLRSAFANYLHMAAAMGKVVLILDALNQLEDRQGAPDLVWLPPEMPPNVRLVLSTLPGRPLEEVERRGWPTLRVEPLEQGEREQLITEYLRQYARALDRPQLERIATAPQSANPLYARALLEELRVWGEHETLGERIDHYLAAGAIDDLYELILERYEGDYEKDRPGLVRDAMSLIWAARRGLSEAELLDLLGTEGKPLPSARWSPLYLAAEQSLASRSGLLGFAHDYLRRAVRDRYLPDEGDRVEAHLRLAEYFDSRRGEPRSVDELPWQLAEAAAWQRLYELLADLDFFGRAWEASEFDVKSHWARIEAGSSLSMVDAYRETLEHPELDWSLVWPLTTLLTEAGHFEQSLALTRRLAVHHEEAGNQEDRVLALEREADTLAVRKDFDDSLSRQREAEALCRELDDRAGLARSLITQAGLTIQGPLRDPDRAAAAALEAERLCDELEDPALSARAQQVRALVERQRGDFDAAMALLQALERSCRERGDMLTLAMCLGNQFETLQGDDGSDAPVALLAEAEQISREIGDKEIRKLILARKAAVDWESGNPDDVAAALEEMEEAARLCRDLDDQWALQVVLGDYAGMLDKRGDRDAALACYEEQEAVCRKLGYREGLWQALEQQAVITARAGDLARSLALRENEEAVLRELGDEQRPQLAKSLAFQAALLSALGRPADARRHAEEARGLAETLPVGPLRRYVESVLERID